MIKRPSLIKDYKVWAFIFILIGLNVSYISFILPENYSKLLEEIKKTFPAQVFWLRVLAFISLNLGFFRLIYIYYEYVKEKNNNNIRKEKNEKPISTIFTIFCLVLGVSITIATGIPNSKIEQYLPLLLGVFGAIVLFPLSFYSAIYDKISDIAAEISKNRVAIEKVTFDKAYHMMKISLDRAKEFVYVTSFIDKNPIKLGDSQREYHEEFKEKVKRNSNITFQRIISISNFEKLDWALELIKDYKTKNFTLYYDEKTSHLKDGDYTPLNMQIYDDEVVIINQGGIKGENLIKQDCLSIASKDCMDYYKDYFFKIANGCKKIIENGNVDDKVLNELLDDFKKKSVQEIKEKITDNFKGKLTISERELKNFALRNIQFFARYQMLYDKLIHLNGSSYEKEVIDIGNNTLELMFVKWNIGEASAIHNHKDSDAIILVLSGEIQNSTFVINNQIVNELEISKIDDSKNSDKDNKAIIIHKNHYHQMKSLKEDTLTVHFYVPKANEMQVIDIIDNENLDLYEVQGEFKAIIQDIKNANNHQPTHYTRDKNSTNKDITGKYKKV